MPLFRPFWKPKKTLDFDDLKDELKRATRAHFQQYRERYPDETELGYCLYSDDDVSTIGPVATGAEALPVGPDDSEYAYYRYGPHEWGHFDDFGLFAHASDMRKSLYAMHDFPTYKNGCLNAALAALRELEAEGVFGPRTESRFIVLWLSDSSDEIMHTAAEELNCPSVWAGYASAYVDSAVPELPAVVAVGTEYNGVAIEKMKALRSAIKEGALEEVRALIDADEKLLQVMTPFGTWVHVAASAGHADILELLARSGIDVNAHGGIKESSALCEAAREGHVDAVRALLRCGATLDVSSPEKNPLFEAIYGNQLDVVSVLLESGLDSRMSYSGYGTQLWDAKQLAQESHKFPIVELLEKHLGAA